MCSDRRPICPLAEARSRPADEEAPYCHLSDPERRIVRLDPSQIEAIADAVAKRVDRLGTKSESRLVSISDATAILGVGRSTIYKLINKGALQTKRIGRRTLVPRSDLDQMLAGDPDS